MFVQKQIIPALQSQTSFTAVQGHFTVTSVELMSLAEALCNRNAWVDARPSKNSVVKVRTFRKAFPLSRAYGTGP